jgi:hypothetical protein
LVTFVTLRILLVVGKHSKETCRVCGPPAWRQYGLAARCTGNAEKGDLALDITEWRRWQRGESRHWVVPGVDSRGGRAGQWTQESINARRKVRISRGWWCCATVIQLLLSSCYLHTVLFQDDSSRSETQNHWISKLCPVFSSYLEFRTMNRVQKPNGSQCYTPPSEPFRFY